MNDAAWTGPALRDVRPDDDGAVRALLREQAARLEVVRKDRLWQWFGGVPSGFGHPARDLWSLYCAFAFVALVGLAFVVVGFTRGPVVWVILALAVLCLVARVLLRRGPVQRTLQFYGRAVVAPAVVVAAERGDPEQGVDANGQPRLRLVLLVSRDVDDAASLARLVESGRRLRAALHEDGDTEGLGELLAAIRDREHYDDTRIDAGAALDRAELQFSEAYDWMLPGDSLRSQLLFVLVDPEDRGPDCARVLSSTFCGDAAESLAAELPWEAA